MLTGLEEVDIGGEGCGLAGKFGSGLGIWAETLGRSVGSVKFGWVVEVVGETYGKLSSLKTTCLEI